jgi:hypothetical protein
MKINGESINIIAKKLKMNPTTIYNILKNKTYLGFNLIEDKSKFPMQSRKEYFIN